MKSEREINEVSISMESDNDAIVQEWTNSITPKLLNDSPLPASCCIFRVPDKIRRKGKQAYEPDIVSIGPFHSGRHVGDRFQLMENVKRWYLQCLLSRANITLAHLITGVMGFDNRARACYQEPLDLNKKEFVEMMVLDGCFLIELFRKGPSTLDQDKNDPVYSVSCMREHLCHDLILLENQLPWFVLEKLYNLTAVNNTTCEGNASSLTDLVLKFLKKIAHQGLLDPGEKVKPPSKILHVLDLIRSVIVEGFSPQEKREEPELSRTIPNVTTLSQAGIKFQEGSKPCILNFKFENGVFTIPPLRIHEETEPLFRNLIAFEQCHHKRLHKITSYAVLMDSLIKSSKDIDILCEKGILANWLSAEDAVQFFNQLYKDTTVVRFYYGILCDDVNKYNNSKWNQWKEKLRREYFGTPWAIISLVAAFILLVFTMLQTVYTIYQYYHPPT